MGTFMSTLPIVKNPKVKKESDGIPETLKFDANPKIVGNFIALQGILKCYGILGNPRNPKIL